MKARTLAIALALGVTVVVGGVRPALAASAGPAGSTVSLGGAQCYSRVQSDGQTYRELLAFAPGLTNLGPTIKTARWWLKVWIWDGVNRKWTVMSETYRDSLILSGYADFKARKDPVPSKYAGRWFYVQSAFALYDTSNRLVAGPSQYQNEPLQTMVSVGYDNLVQNGDCNFL